MNLASILVHRRTLLAGAASALAAPLVHAEADYPNKPIRLLLPASPGSSLDTTARQIAIPLASSLGQPVVVENVAGASGVIGVQQMLRAPKDGYTIGMVVNNFTISAYTYKLPYDPRKDVVPIAVMAMGPMVLVVNPKLPVKNLAEFFKLAKSRNANTTLSYGSPGVGTLAHLCAALMEMSAGTSLLHVPYKGQDGFTNDLIGGQLDAGFLAVQIAAPLIRNGSLRALAVTTSQRAGGLPEVPTMSEAGLPSYELAGWVGAIAAAGTPPAIIRRLNTEIVRTLRTPDVAKALERQSMQTVGGTPEEAARWFTRDFEVIGKLAGPVGLKPEN